MPAMNHSRPTSSMQKKNLLMDGLIMVLPAHEFTFAFDRSMSAAVSPAALTPDNPSLGFKLFGFSELASGSLGLARVSRSRPGRVPPSNAFPFRPDGFVQTRRPCRSCCKAMSPLVLPRAAIFERRGQRYMPAPLHDEQFPAELWPCAFQANLGTLRRVRNSVPSSFGMTSSTKDWLLLWPSAQIARMC